jgi:signal transduction histidine kinase
VDRRATLFPAWLKHALDVLDAQLSRLGRLGSTVALTAMTVGVSVPLHFLVRKLEGLEVQSYSMVNLAVELIFIAGPIFLYARDVITELNASRAKLREMSRRLSSAVAQAENANRAKSAFLANMSHELRTPLNAIMGFSEMMKDQHLGPVNNPHYLAYAGDIHASGGYLLGIINDILDLSKIEAGKMSLDTVEEFPLCQALSASLAMVAPLSEKSGVALIGDLPGEAVRILAAERMIRQIMINLLGNAIKFTNRGGAVHVCGAPDTEGGYTISVRDTGLGMSGEDIAHALQPFGQIENRMTAKHKGTGLGLPLAKAMMELHGGTLAIDSTPDRGTTVLLTFPAARIVSPTHMAAA